MATIIRATLPTDQFALSETLQSIPSAEFRIVRMFVGRSDCVEPFLWAAADDGDHADLPDAVEADSSTDEVDVVSELDGEYLLRAEWTAEVGLIRHVLVEERGTVLDAQGGRDGWMFRMLFPRHESVSSTHEYCEAEDVDIHLEQISKLRGTFRQGKFGLTQEQYDAILGAYQSGYYTVPRTVKLADLADQFGVSHQALSERLRRGHEKLVGNVFNADGGDLVTNV